MRPRRVLIALVTLAAAALLAPASAGAHAVLERTVPARGADLRTQPQQVVFLFSEPVESAFGAIRVYDSSGEEVQAGEIERPVDDGSGIAIALEPDLADGTYTATYRVVSADSHPVSGGFVFSIGNPSAGGATVAELLGRQRDTGGTSSAAFVADRWIGYVATALLVGGIAFLLLVSAPALAAGERPWRNAAASVRARLRRLTLVAALAGLAATVLSLPLQIAAAAGIPFTDAVSTDDLGELLSTRYGVVEVIRAGAFALLIPVVAVGLRGDGAGRDRPRVLLAAAAAPSVAFLLLAPALAGHASTQEPTWLLFPLDVLHVAAMALWLGGLAALLIALPAATAAIDPGQRGDLLLAVLRRFSPLALGCVVALALSGTVQAIVEVGSFGALLDTGFGRAVLIKAALLIALIGLGFMNRNRLLPAIAAGAGRPPGTPGRRLRANLRLELLGIAAALVAAAMMTGYAPPSEAAKGPVSGSVTVGSNYLEYTVEPATVGANQLHLYLFDSGDGGQVEPQELTVTASLRSKDVGPIELDPREAGPGHFVVQRAAFGIAGDWTIEVTVRTSRFDQDEVEFDVPIER